MPCYRASVGVVFMRSGMGMKEDWQVGWWGMQVCYAMQGGVRVAR